MTTRIHPEAKLLNSPLLLTESKDTFDQIRDALTQEIKPRTFVERIYVCDIAYHTLEILRYRRCKANIINLNFLSALEKLLAELLRQPREYGAMSPAKDAYQARELALKWFSDPTGKREVLDILEHFHLDESAVEAEAIRGLTAQLEPLDRLLASAESRRNRTLGCIFEYRAGFVQQLRKASDRIIESKILALEHDGGSKEPTTAA